MADKTIRFNVDSREVQDYQSKMREQSQRMAVDLVNYARSQTQSSKETLRLIEEQISAIERRNKIDREMRSDVIGQSLQEKKIDLTRYREEIKKLDAESRQEDIQVKLLRELIEVTRMTSRDEIRSDKENAERFAREDYSEDELDNLRRVFTRKELGLDDQKAPENAGRQFSAGPSGQLLTGLATGNLSGVAAGLLTILGVGGVAAALAGIAINTQRQYETGLLSYAVARQTPMSQIKTEVGSLRSPSLGMSSLEVAQKVSELMRSYGGELNENVDGSVRGLLGAGVSRGISDQALNQLMSISRYSGTPALGTVGNLEDYLNKMSRPLIRLPELLDIYLQKSNEILQRGGVLYAEGLQQTMMSVSSSYGAEGINLSRMMNSLGSAAGTQSSNPIMEALKLQVLQEMYPQMSQWERFGVMEHALSDPEYIKNLIGKVKGIGLGGGESYQRFAVANLLGMGFEDVNRLMSGDFNIEQINRPSGKTTQERNEELSGKYEDASKEMIGAFSKMLIEMSGVKDKMTEYIGKFEEHVKATNQYYKDEEEFRGEVRRRSDVIYSKPWG